MARRIRRGSPEYAALFDGFGQSAFRLETLQHYAGEDEAEALRAFLRGDAPPMYPGKESWTARVRRAVAAGKSMQRVHLVREPLTDYLRYEIGWSYGLNVAAGEDIRLLPAADGQFPAGLGAAGDFWLFDSHALVRMNYDDAGQMTGAVLEKSPRAIALANAWRDAALRAATPYSDYVSWHEGQLQRAS
jgi:hypothetical protein